LRPLMLPLRWYRLKARMTGFELAVASGVNLSYIYMVESGGVKKLNPERIAALAKVLASRLGLPYERLYREILNNEPIRKEES